MKLYVQSQDRLIEFDVIAERKNSWIVANADRGAGAAKISKAAGDGHFASTDRDEAVKAVCDYIDGKIEEYRELIAMYEAEKEKL